MPWSSMAARGPLYDMNYLYFQHGEDGHHLADDIFKCIFVNEKFCISIKISLNFVPKGPIDNNAALV